MVDLFTRMSSAVEANKDIWDIELEWILSQGCFTGVRVNIGMSGEISADPATADISYLEYVLRRVAANGLKCQLGLGGEGPNKDNEEWWIYNSGGPWLSTKRPPIGGSNLIAYYSAGIKSVAIAIMVEVYESYGLKPYDYCFIELGNEPAVGGSGAPPPGDTFYTTFGLTYTTTNDTAVGLWDKATDLTGASATDGAAYLEFFTVELGFMDLKGLRCIAPSFAAKRMYAASGVYAELNSFDRATATGDKWIDLVREKNELIFSINCYYNTFDLLTTGIHPEQYCWPTCGPIDYAEMAVFGFDGRGVKSGDSQCILYKVNQIRDKAKSRIGDSPLIVGEAGVHYRFMGMTDDPATGPVAGTGVARDPNYYVNMDLVGDAELEYLDRLRDSGFTYVIHFSVSDAITNYSATDAWKEIYGIFRLDSSISGIPTLQMEQSYSKAIAWARRYGLPTTGGTSIATSNKGAFWGKRFEKGDNENVP